MNILPFPNIKDNQVVLLRNDLYTGIVKDKNMATAVNETQEVWTIYNKNEEALSDAQKIVDEYDHIECFIFDKNKTALHHITPT